LADDSPAFHPDPEVVLAYAAGTLDEASSVLVATHLALCPRCRRDAARLDAVGGALADGLEPVPLSAGALEATLARLDRDEPPPPAAPPERRYDLETRRAVPEPLRSYLDGDLSALPWRWRGFAVRELPIDIAGDGVRASLIRVRAGAALPAHTHTGVETTLVLSGAFQDGDCRFARGDVATATHSIDHRPVATPEAECLCFAVIDGPLRLTGPVGRLLNRFVRM
jgi:putative transcriptional regulator